MIRFFGTAFGLGALPWAPGTWGTLAGVGAAALCLWLPVPAAGIAVLIFAVTLAGVPLARAAEQEAGREDPGWFVVDEVAGYLVAVLGQPLTARTLPVLLAGFVLFRLFDTLKPWPVRRLERLPGGWGVMVDDFMAGVYANIVAQILFRTGLL